MRPVHFGDGVSLSPELVSNDDSTELSLPSS
jgi:hypothetical protein